jgi:hypothetical protein
MRLSAKALAVSFGILWGGCLFLVGLINLADPLFGADFLRGMASVYPGFYGLRTFWDVLLGTFYGLIDGAVGGWIFGWLYNYFARPKTESGTSHLDRAA